jgi:hypothetical protein
MTARPTLMIMNSRKTCVHIHLFLFIHLFIYRMRPMEIMAMYMSEGMCIGFQISNFLPERSQSTVPSR